MVELPLINWYPDLIGILLLDLGIAIVLLASIRKLAGMIGNVSSTNELSQKDNTAFAITFAGGMTALAIMLTGAISGEPGQTLLNEALLVIVYGILGIVLMALARFTLDKIALSNISIHDEIMRGNTAAAIVDVSNMIATAIIVRAIMIWVDDTGYIGLIAVVSGFLISQALLILVTLYRSRVHSIRHPDKTLQQAFAAGNRAIAIRYFGHKVGIACAVTAASGFVPYNPDNLLLATLIWGGFSLILTVVLSLLAIAARHIILAKIDVVTEVDEQKNIGIGIIEAMIYITIGLLLAGLIA